jgi:hypothetical protein
MDVPRAQKFCDSLAAAGVRAFLTDCSDIEGYYLNAEHLHALNPQIQLERIRQLIDQAATNVEQASLEAIINLRTEEAFRQRNKGGGPPNHGAIAIQAQTDLAADRSGLTRGKLALSNLQTLLQQEMGANPRIFFPSDHLRVPALSSIANDIWPQ